MVLRICQFTIRQLSIKKDNFQIIKITIILERIIQLRNALEDIFAIAENGAGCVCTNTGVSALALLFDTVLKSDDTILVERDCYGGTYRLLNILA